MDYISVNNLSKGNAEIFVTEKNGKYFWLLADFEELYMKTVSADDLSFYSEIPKSLFNELIKLNKNTLYTLTPVANMADIIRNNPK